MARTGSTRSGRKSAWLALTIVALTAGFVFAGTGLEAEPPVEARETAAEAAAVRIALDMPLFQPAPQRARVEAYQPQPLLSDGEELQLAGEATRVRIASVGIDAEVRPVGYVFRQGELQYGVPRLGAGHYSGTVAPGDAGNAVIAGHVSSRSGPAVFRELPNVRIGEIVEVFRGGQIYRYSITEIRVVAADATAVMAQTQDATLTLITCSPGQNFQKRFVVVGKLI